MSSSDTSRPPGGFWQCRRDTNSSKQPHSQTQRTFGGLSQRHTLDTGHAPIKCSLNICVMAGSQTQAALLLPLLRVCDCGFSDSATCTCVSSSSWSTTTSFAVCVCLCVIQPPPQFLTPDSSWLLPSSVSPTFAGRRNKAAAAVVVVVFNQDKLQIGRSRCQVCHFLLIRRNITYN